MTLIEAISLFHNDPVANAINKTNIDFLPGKFINPFGYIEKKYSRFIDTINHTRILSANSHIPSALKCIVDPIFITHSRLHIYTERFARVPTPSMVKALAVLSRPLSLIIRAKRNENRGK
jgi:hypothetical protein